MSVALSQLDGPSTTTPKPSGWSVWLAAIRPRTLPAAISPVVVGTALAAAAGALHLPSALAALLGALLIQIGTNLANDYSDWRKGADTAERIGPPRVTQQGWLTPRAVAGAAGASLAIAVVFGVYLVARGGWPIALIGLLSIVCAVTYTGGPRPFGYHGLGDAAVFIFFGPVAVCGTYFVQARQLAIAPIAASVAIGCLVTAILVVNNTRDRHSDAAAGKRTLSVKLGLTGSRVEYAVLVGLPYAVAPLATLSGFGHAGWLLPLLSLPLAIREVHQVWTRDGMALNASLGSTARLGLVFALFLCVGVQL